MSIKEKAAEIAKNLQELVNNDATDTEITTKIQLTAEQMTIFQLIKIFSKTADSTLTDEEIINRNGKNYTVKTTVMFYDDAYDGTEEAGTDSLGQDYKSPLLKFLGTAVLGIKMSLSFQK